MIEEGIDAGKIKELSRVKKVSILIFVWSAFLFFLGLQYKLNIGYNILLFWLPMLFMIGIIVYQIFFLKGNRYNSFIILFEIFLVYLLLHLIYMVGYYGLRGSDSYIDYNFLKEILTNHSFRLEVSFSESVTGYPMIHIFSSIISTIGKINPLLVAKFLPSLISSLIVLPIYILAHRIYNDKRIALFSCLIFGTIPQFMSFETAFIREVIALFFMILFFYLLYISDQRTNYRFYLLIFILIPAIIFAHHLTSLMLLSLLIIYLMASKLLPYFLRVTNYLFYKRKGMVSGVPGKLNRWVLAVVFIFSVSLFSYLFYLYGIDFAIGFLRDIFNDVLGLRHAGGTYAEGMGLWSPIVTLKGNIIFYGFFFYILLFSLLLLIKFFMKNAVHKIVDSTFIVYYFFCMFLSFLTMFVVSNMAFPERFLPFALVFGLIPLMGLLLILKKNMYKKILVILFISFIIFNLYNIDTNNYTSNATFTGGAASDKEYLIAQHISFPNKYYGYIAASDAIYDVQGIDPKLGAMDLSLIKDLGNSSAMAVINEAVYLKDLKNLQQKSPEEYSNIVEMLSYKNDKGIDKVCDFGQIYVIKGGE